MQQKIAKLWQRCDKDAERKVTRPAAEDYDYNWATQTYIYKIYISNQVYKTTFNQI